MLNRFFVAGYSCFKQFSQKLKLFPYLTKNWNSLYYWGGNYSLNCYIILLHFLVSAVAWPWPLTSVCRRGWASVEITQTSPVCCNGMYGAALLFEYVTSGYVLKEINRQQSAQKRIYFSVLLNIWSFCWRESAQEEEPKPSNWVGFAVTLY
jgi:hypothetical protein